MAFFLVKHVAGGRSDMRVSTLGEPAKALARVMRLMMREGVDIRRGSWHVYDGDKAGQPEVAINVRVVRERVTA